MFFKKENFIFGPCIWILILTTDISVYSSRMEDLSILDDLMKRGYDRRATPTNHLNTSMPTIVYCELFVRSFGSPNPLTMDYKVDLFLRQKWRDERLQHENLTQPLDLNDPNLVKGIWKPEVYFPNAKEADFQFVTVPNVLVRINPDGKILYMLRLRVTFSCDMDLRKFPLDTQTCTMEVASFSKTVEELVLEWKEEEAITIGNLGMSQFELEKIVAAKCKESFQIGQYSCLVAEFHLSRSLGFHLVQSYLPTILMVAISWVSFWMDVNSVPGRVTLGVTTLLTISSKSTNIQENFPQASYVKAIDVWMGTSFVFLALLEFTVVNYLWRKDFFTSRDQIRKMAAAEFESQEAKKSKSTPTTPCHTLIQMKGGEKISDKLNGRESQMTVESRLIKPTTSSSNENHGNEELITDVPFIPVEGREFFKLFGSEKNSPRPGEYQNMARVIDETSRYAFPFAFIIFNFVYWPYYLYT